MTKKLFEGIKVLDFTNNAAGPIGVGMLAAFGADIIKVERPVFGDDIRGFAPQIDGQSIMGMYYNRGKKSITIALDDPEGIEIIKKIIPQVDVITESFRPGIMKKFGLDYESVKSLNPQVVYCSVSAYGQTGPYSKKPGYDLITQALCGVMDMTGDPDGPPRKSGFIIGDFVGGMNAYAAIASALYYKKATGEGQYLDIALLDCMVAMNNFVELAYTGTVQHRIGEHHSAICPYGIFNNDIGESIIICAPNNKLWELLCKVMNRSELINDSHFSSGPARIKNLQLVIEVIEGWLKSFGNIEEAAKMMEEGGIPCAKVKTAEDVLNDEHLWQRGMITEVEMPPSVKKYKKLKMRGMWIHMSKTPFELRRPPDLGEHNYEVLESFGMNKEQIDVLQNKWKEQVLGKKKGV